MKITVFLFEPSRVAPLEIFPQYSLQMFFTGRVFFEKVESEKTGGKSRLYQDMKIIGAEVLILAFGLRVCPLLLKRSMKDVFSWKLLRLLRVKV